MSLLIRLSPQFHALIHAAIISSCSWLKPSSLHACHIWQVWFKKVEDAMSGLVTLSNTDNVLGNPRKSLFLLRRSMTRNAQRYNCWLFCCVDSHASVCSVYALSSAIAIYIDDTFERMAYFKPCIIVWRNFSLFYYSSAIDEVGVCYFAKRNETSASAEYSVRC